MLKWFSILLAFTSFGAKADGISAYNVIRNVYSVTPVTTSAWVSLGTNLSAVTRALSIFDSSGQTMVLGLGKAGSQVAQPWYIFPGGMDSLPVTWAAGSNLWIEAISGTASAGEIDINLYQ
jgi:hypothetical protein